MASQRFLFGVPKLCLLMECEMYFVYIEIFNDVYE